jgi:hypothetical protein
MSSVLSFTPIEFVGGHKSDWKFFKSTKDIAFLSFVEELTTFQERVCVILRNEFKSYFSFEIESIIQVSKPKDVVEIVGNV